MPAPGFPQPLCIWAESLRPRPGCGRGLERMGHRNCCPVQREALRLKCPYAHNHQKLGGPERWGSAVGASHGKGFWWRWWWPKGASEDKEEGTRRRRSSLVGREAQAKLSWGPTLLGSGPASFPPSIALRWLSSVPSNSQGNRGSERLRDSLRATLCHQGIVRPQHQVWHLFRPLSRGSEGEAGQASNSC